MVILWLGLILAFSDASSFQRFPPFPRKSPVDCVVQYSEWTACSIPCGPGGVQLRWGEIIKQARFGGKRCPPLEQQRGCVGNPNCDEPKPVDCQVWFGEWSQCSQNCGGGFQWRRGVIEVEPKNGGKPCPELTQEQPCNNHECDQPRRDCQVWFGDWSQCSTSCGGGFQWRRGVIEVEPQNGGKPCPELEQEQECNTNNCDEPNSDCKVSYADWSACSKPCGGGFQWRRGTIIEQQQGSGKPCPPLEEEQACNRHECTTAPIDCEVRYSQWSLCSQPCGGGVQRRWGGVSVQQENGGAPCPPLEQEKPCNEHLCDVPVVDCEVKFTEWSACSVPCGGGEQTRWGRIQQKPSNGGVPCPELEQSRPCNEEPCLTPVDCALWFPDWSQCSASCGGGFQWRRGLIEVAPQNGGKPCPPTEQEQPCNDFECDEPNVDCKVTYAEWSECSQPCGGGSRWRRGVITQFAIGSGKPCPIEQELQEEESCNTFQCTPEVPVDCLVWYSQWSACSKVCGGGTQRRWGRIEQQPTPGGAPCPPPEQERACNEHLCTVPSVDCEVEYSEWSACSATCAGGVQRRWGRVKVEARNGGAPCPPLEEERECNSETNCLSDVVDCVVEYTQWTPCSRLCGGGTRQRWGDIKQSPTPGGAPCPPLEPSEECNTTPCAIPYRFKRSIRYRRPSRPGPRFPPVFPKRPPPVFPVPKKQPKIFAIDCTKLPDGNFNHPTKPCFNKYYTCSNGEPSERTCQFDMYYNKEIDGCDIFAYVPACSGGRRPRPTTAKPSVTRVTPDPDFDCSSRRDGDYPDPRSKCSRRWFHCLNSFTTKRVCPNRLYYDAESKTCQPWQKVYKCSGVRTATTEFPSDFATLPPVPINCGKLPDGPHPDPTKKCSRRFYECTNHNGHEMQCPGKTRFNPELRTCDDFNNIFVCSGRRPQPTTVATTTAAVRFPFDCTERDDGYYPASRCKTFYWACSGGVTQKIACGEGLHYDIKLKVCQNRRHIPQCGGRRPTTPLLLPTTTGKPIPSVNFDCSKRVDGNFPAGDCKRFYYSCSGSIARKMDCAPSTFYDSELNECNKRKVIPKCGGRRPTTTQPPNLIPTTTLKSYYGKPVPRKPVRVVSRPRPIPTRTRPSTIPRPRPRPFPRPRPRPRYRSSRKFQRKTQIGGGQLKLG